MTKIKIFLLFACLVLLILFTVYSYDYNSILKDNEVNNKTRIHNTYDKYKDELVSKYNIFKTYVLKSIYEKEKKATNTNKITDSVSFNTLKITKKGSDLLLEGTFSDEKQAKEIARFLDVKLVSKEIKKDIKKNIPLLAEVKSLIVPFKDTFTNDSEILIKDQNITINAVCNKRIDEKAFQNLLKEKNIVFTVKKITEDNDVTLNLSNEESNIVASKDTVTKKDTNKEVEKVATNKQIQEEINQTLKRNKINFKRASTDLTKESNKTVENIAQILKKYSHIKVEIGGHTDSKGRKSLNKRISQKRADAVMKVLIKLGVKSSRLSAVGYGEEFPIAKEDELGLSEENRRVEIKILEK